ncbi:MAG: hypothetical protein U0M12_05960 [Acutalibacteraceae bacterium]|nr:hypothetical protein [Acutalibacteraceae bacterium]
MDDYVEKYSKEPENSVKSVANSKNKHVIVNSPDEFSKDYKPVVLNENENKEVTRPNSKFIAYKSENTVNNIYISEGSKSIKRRELHQVDTKITEILKMMNISENDNLPTIYIISSKEMNKNAVAAYRAADNSLFIDMKFAIYGKNNVPEIVKGFACPSDDRSMFVHELFHWADAQNFRNKFGEITAENYNHFENFVQNNAKKQLDKLRKSGYDVFDISDYATSSIKGGKFDEAYTEYRVRKILGR